MNIISAIISIIYDLGYISLIILLLILLNDAQAAVCSVLLPPRRPRELSQLPPADELPHVLVQLPVYNEELCVERVLRVAAGLDWPRDRLHVQLLDSSTDGTTAIASRVITELRQAGTDVTHLRLNVHDGYKAGALNAGLAKQNNPYVVILDADFQVPADWLRAAMRILLANPDAAFVQLRHGLSNATKNWLTRMQQLLVDAHFLMLHEGYYRQSGICMFHGTAGIWRTDAINDAGRWSADGPGEDWDLTVRAYLKGWRGIFVNRPTALATGEAVSRLGDLVKQQRRWGQGTIRNERRLSGRILRSDLPLIHKYSLIMWLIFPIAYPCFDILVISRIVHGVFIGPSLWFVYATIGMTTLTFLFDIGVTLPPYIVFKRGSLLDYAKIFFPLRFIFLYLCLTIGLAVVRAILGQQLSFDRTPKTGD